MVLVDFTVSARRLIDPVEIWLPSLPNITRYAYAVERGAGGYLHYQCKADFAMPEKDILLMFQMLHVHVEISRSDAFDYIFKSGCYFCSWMEPCPDWTPAQWVLTQYFLSEGDNDRSVCCVVDQTGNTGKTYYSRALEDMCIAVRVPQIPADKVSGFLISQPKYGVYVFDLTKVTGRKTKFVEELMCQIEELKNGEIADWRYNGKRWRYGLGSTVKVLVLCNREPDHSYLSADRWKVIYT